METKRGRKRKKMGRPARPASEVRKNRLTATFTDSELRLLDREARRLAIPAGTLLYRLAIQALKGRRP